MLIVFYSIDISMYYPLPISVEFIAGILILLPSPQIFRCLGRFHLGMIGIAGFIPILIPLNLHFILLQLLYLLLAMLLNLPVCDFLLTHNWCPLLIPIIIQHALLTLLTIVVTTHMFIMFNLCLQNLMTHVNLQYLLNSWNVNDFTQHMLPLLICQQLYRFLVQLFIHVLLVCMIIHQLFQFNYVILNKSRIFPINSHPSYTSTITTKLRDSHVPPAALHSHVLILISSHWPYSHSNSWELSMILDLSMSDCQLMSICPYNEINSLPY